MGAALSLRPSYYEALRRLTLEMSGISLGKDHHFLVETRLGALERKEGFESLPDMIDELFSRGQTRLAVNVVSALLQHDKPFFDDREGFDVLETSLFETLTRRFGGAPLKALVFGCGAGQDAYALMMSVEETRARLPQLSCDIMAVDYPSWALDRAIEGRYTHFEVQRGLPIRRLVKYFKREAEDWRVKSDYRDKVRFKDWHLMSAQDKLGTFHLILFRNSLSRYSAPAKVRLLRLLAPSLHTGGCLMLGQSETTGDLTSSFAPEGNIAGVFTRIAPVKHEEPAPPKRTDFNDL